MSENKTLSAQDRLLAAEHALGVLSGTGRAEADRRMDRDPVFRQDVESWDAQLAPLMDEIDEVPVPNAVWENLETRLFEAPRATAVEPVGGVWKLVSAFTGTLAVASFAALVYVTGGDFSGEKLKQFEQQVTALQAENAEGLRSLEDSRSKIDMLQSEVAEANNKIQANEQALSVATQQTEAANADLAQAQANLMIARQAAENAELELAELVQRLDEARPLVASLTQSGDVPAFVAQYDPARQALLIRSAVSDADEKVPELWLIPNEGADKGKALSMGVLDEDAPNVLAIEERFVGLMQDGGTLAITMEPPGGAPGGVATGPVIALGTLRSF